MIRQIAWAPAMALAIAAIALAGCASDTVPRDGGKVQIFAPNDTADYSGLPGDKTGGRIDTAASPASLARYRCVGNFFIDVNYPTRDNALVKYHNRTEAMSAVEAPDGARYENDDMAWWTHGTGPGSEGTLRTHKSNGQPGDVVASCKEIDPEASAKAG